MKEQEPDLEANVIFLGALAFTATVMGMAWVLRRIGRAARWLAGR